jgi:hypothetical protein
MAPFEMIRHGTWSPAEGYRYAKAREDLATKATQEKTGLTGDVVETVGALATLPGNIFARQTAAALGGAGRGVMPAAARMAGFGAESGVLGAVQGAGNAQSVEDIPREALRSGAVSAVLGAPFGAFANVARRSTAAVPTETELSTLGARDYRARDRAPVSYTADYVADRLDDLHRMTRGKYGRDVPQTAATLQRLSIEARDDIARAAQANAAQGAVPPGTVVPPGQVSGVPNPWQATLSPRDIASLRREIYEGGATGSATDERAGTIAAKVMDRILTRPDPASLARGTPRDAATVAMLDARARGNFGAGFRSKAVTEQIEAAKHTAGGQHSGLNFENILRQNLNRARKNEAFGNFNAAEDAAVEQLIKGTTKSNKIRELGNLLGGGGGLGRMVAMGGGAGGCALTSYLTGGDPWAGAAVGLGLGTTGRVLRNYGNARMDRAAQAFAEDLRRRSPEYLRRAATAPTAIPDLDTPSGLRALLTLGGGGGIRDAIARSMLYNMTGER